MARTETTDAALDLLVAIADLARELPTAAELAMERENLECNFEAMAELHPDRAAFWHHGAEVMGAYLTTCWHATHATESPTGDLEANGGAVAESGQLTTGRV